MQQIYQKLLAADRLILAAPIFSMNLNAQAKALIDRSQRFWSTKFILKRPVIADAAARPKRTGIFLSACGTAFPDMFDCAVKVVRYYFNMLEIKYDAGHFYWQIDAPGAIINHPTALQDVFEAGRRLVSENL
jgi:FMN-dependent NADH-azoreductase